MASVCDGITRPVSASATPAQLAAYTAAYERGWDGARGGARTQAWYDGRLDRAAGRARWHLLHCPDHGTCGPDTP